MLCSHYVGRVRCVGVWSRVSSPYTPLATTVLLLSTLGSVAAFKVAKAVKRQVLGRPNQ